MKKRIRITFSHKTVWFYEGDNIICTYRKGSRIWFDHRSGEWELKWFKESFLERN